VTSHLELGCYPLKLKERPKDDPTQAEALASSINRSNIGRNDSSIKKYEQLLKDNLKGIKMVADEKERWHLLSKELSQKQELVHRLKKEYDEKTENLKIIGNEIVELRRELKLELSENGMLKKRLAQEEKLEIHKMVTKEMMTMTPEELRTKLVKVSQAYKEERNRNEEFEKAIKAAHRDMVEVRKTQKKYEDLERIHAEKSKKLLSMQQELRKINVYRDTIKKQEKVILKLEQLLENTMKDTEKASKQAIDLEKIRSENLELQEKLKQKVYGKRENEEIERYREEVRKLERIKAEIQEELKYKRPVSSQGQNLDQQNFDLEVQLKKAEARVESLQSELNKNAKRYSEEIAQLQAVLNEKTSTLDAYNFKAYGY
jgi:chromosome segregation ATPase